MMLIGIAIKERAHVWKWLAAGYVLAHIIAVVALELLTYSASGEISALAPVSVILIITSVMTHSVKGYYEKLEDTAKQAIIDADKAAESRAQEQRDKEQEQRDKEAADAREDQRRLAQLELQKVERLAQIELEKAERLAQIEADNAAQLAQIGARDNELQLKNKRKADAAKRANAVQKPTANAVQNVSAFALGAVGVNGNGAVKKHTLATLPADGRNDILCMGKDEFVQKWGVSDRSFFNWRPKIAKDEFNGLSGEMLIALVELPSDDLPMKVSPAVHDLWSSWVREMDGASN